jgi:hypothetical protein
VLPVAVAGVNDVSDYDQWREGEATRLVASGAVDTNTVRELLVLACHSSPVAGAFFTERLDDAQLLTVLLGIATEDDSGDAQMTASYWVSQFPHQVLRSHLPELEAIAVNEWGSVTEHARRTLVALGYQPPPQRSDEEGPVSE